MTIGRSVRIHLKNSLSYIVRSMLVFFLIPFCSHVTESLPLVSDSAAAASVSAQNDSSIIWPGEDLLYEVSYAGIPLGRIRVRTQNSDTLHGLIFHHASAFVDSYEGIPFVDIHVIDSTHMDTVFYSKGFHSLEWRDDKWFEEASHYDLSNHRIIVWKSYHRDPYSPDEAPRTYDTVSNVLDGVQDGLSLFFFARSQVRNQSSITVPTVVYGKQGMTEFHFATERRLEYLDLIHDKKIRVVGLKGIAHFTGLYGMTGDFQGWFTDDEAAIPIKAQLGVFLGNVSLELIWWKRDGWVPPTAPEQ